MSGTGPHDPELGTALPVTIPGDLVLLRRPGLAIWAGAVSAWREGFEFTLLMLHDFRVHGEVLDFAPVLGDQGAGVWLSIRFADGRTCAADVDTKRTLEQPAGPGLQVISGFAAGNGANDSRWQVRPLPPHGLVQLTISLGGPGGETVGSGSLDGTAILAATRGDCSES
jgi:hypothetical protein